MTARELRDHSQPCEHAPDDINKRGQFAWDKYTMGHTISPGGRCPGGKLVRMREHTANDPDCPFVLNENSDGVIWVYDPDEIVEADDE